MRFKSILAMGLVSAALQSQVQGLPVEWEAALPEGSLFRGGTPKFNLAVRTVDGGYVVSGGTDEDQRLIGLGAGGGIQWRSGPDTAHGTEWVMPAASMRATPHGVAVIRTARVDGELFLLALLFNRDGHEVSRVVLDGNKERTSLDSLGNAYYFEAQVLDPFFEVPPDVAIRKRSLTGGAAWRADLGKARKYTWYALRTGGSGETKVAAARPGGGESDSMIIWSLSASGEVEWTLPVRTGAGDGRLPPEVPQLKVDWNLIAITSEGNTILAGVERSQSDSLVMMSATSDGRLAWLRKYRLQALEPRGGSGNWRISDLSRTGPGGFRLQVQWNAPQKSGGCSRLVEFDGGGARTGMDLQSPMQRPNVRWDAGPDGINGELVGIGATEDTLRRDPLTHDFLPWSLGFPSIFLADPRGTGSMKALRLEGFADTVYAMKIHSWDRAFDTGYAETPAIESLIPTSDGGALAVGRLNRRTGSGPIYVTAIKLAPGFSVGLAPVSRNPGKHRLGEGRRIDLLGRERGVGNASSGFRIHARQKR